MKASSTLKQDIVTTQSIKKSKLGVQEQEQYSRNQRLDGSRRTNRAKTAAIHDTDRPKYTTL